MDMTDRIVLTLTGSDRIGLVEHVTDLILECAGDVQASRMARLGGEFAMLMLVSIPDGNSERLFGNMENLAGEGFKVTITETEGGLSAARKDWLPYRIEVRGANHEGIIHEIAEHLSKQGINIESIDTDVLPEPMSGAPLFTMEAIVLVPPGLSEQPWQEELAEVADRLNVDLEMSVFKDGR
jgi:glycine cleavage system transcriptional repressor